MGWKLTATVAAGAGLAVYILHRNKLANAAKCTAAEAEVFASTDDSARVALLKALFARLFGAAPEVVALAGGRVNLIGEHVDYPDVQFAGEPVVHLFSMGGAIQNNYLAAVSKRSDGKVVLCHTLVGEVYTVALDDIEAVEAQAQAERNGSVPMKDRSTPVPHVEAKPRSYGLPASLAAPTVPAALGCRPRLPPSAAPLCLAPLCLPPSAAALGCPHCACRPRLPPSAAPLCLPPSAATKVPPSLVRWLTLVRMAGPTLNCSLVGVGPAHDGCGPGDDTSWGALQRAEPAADEQCSSWRWNVQLRCELRRAGPCLSGGLMTSNPASSLSTNQTLA